MTSVPFLDLGATHEALRPAFDAVWEDVVNRTAFIGGDYADRFEGEWADYVGVDHAIAVANGTDSIELILRGLDVGPGDEVIVPANTFIATAEAVVACGASPVYCDVEPTTLLATAETIAPKITDATVAVIVVHLYGQPCQMDDIVALTEAKSLALIEDAAQAHGATWNGSKAGSFGTAASFSFYPGKNLGAFGDAGAVVTNDTELAARVRSLANHGRADGQHVVHALMGRNSRMDGLQAGVLSVKLPYLDEWNQARRKARDLYTTEMAALELPVSPIEEAEGAVSVWHLNVIQVDNRDVVLAAMSSRGVDVRIHYPQPCHHHPSVQNPQTLPVVDASSPRLLSLPMFPTITDEQIAVVCRTLSDVLSES